MRESARVLRNCGMHNDFNWNQLSEEQRRAVMHGEGPMLVNAGPGSGKTFTLTGRILYLIRVRQIPPEKILVITFTREAARSMQARFYQMSNITSQNVNFGTFHSFFYQIIKSVNFNSPYHIISEQEKHRILIPLLQKYQENPQAVPAEEERLKFLSAVGFFQNTGDMDGAMEKLGESSKKEHFPQILQGYLAEKERRHEIDYDDMLTICEKILDTIPGCLHLWQNRFSYFLIDEFQDCNPIQYRMIRKLVKAPHNLFVVGDDDQAIYGFRGAAPELLQRFLQDFPKAAKVTLGINYRCGAKIVEASAKVIAENQNRLEKTLKACGRKTDNAEVLYRYYQTGREERAAILECLSDKSAEELGREAVLFRTNAQMQMFAVYLFRHHVPYYMKEKSVSLYQHFVIQDIMDFYRAAQGKRDRRIFLKLISRPRSHISREAFQDETVDLEKVKAYYRIPVGDSKRALEELERLERNLARLQTMRPALGIPFICHAFGYERYLQLRADGNRELTEEWRGLLTWLSEDSERFCSFEEWEMYQEEYTRTTKKRPIQKKEHEKGLQLMTMHAAKGLEYDTVYIPNVNEGNIPKYKRGEELSPQHLEEERRLFYVAMTRAERKLWISCQTGTQDRPLFPSRFIPHPRQ